MKSKPVLILIVFLLLLQISCAIPFFSVGQTPQPVDTVLLVTEDPNATSTPTPFLPLGPTSTPTITLTPTTGPSPTPTQWYSNLNRPEGQVNILVLGSDFRPGSGFRTDVIMLVSIFTREKYVSVVSFPRDMWVEIPGNIPGRINTALARGGFPLMADTMELNFGIRPDNYIMTNFQGFVKIVDSLGGLEVQTGQRLSDTCDLPQAVNGYCTVGPGPVTMNGNTALWYVRSRYSTDDFNRTRRTQEVMRALFTKLMGLNAIIRAPELFSTYSSNVETDLKLSDILTLLPVAPALTDSDRIRQYFIGREQVQGYVIPESGAQVQLPREEAIRNLIIEAVFTLPE